MVNGLAVLFQLEGTGLHGKVHTFEKPWFTTFESAAACWVSILMFWLANTWHRARAPSGLPAEQEPLLASAQSTAGEGPNPFAGVSPSRQKYEHVKTHVLPSEAEVAYGSLLQWGKTNNDQSGYSAFVSCCCQRVSIATLYKIRFFCCTKGCCTVLLYIF